MITKRNLPHTDIQDCAQASTISSMFQVLEQLSNSHLEERQERREAEKRIIEALEKMADQGARINNLEAANVEHKKEINLLYGLHRELEKEVREEDPRITTLYHFYQVTTNKYILTGATLLTVLLIINIAYTLCFPNSALVQIFKGVLNLFGI